MSDYIKQFFSTGVHELIAVVGDTGGGKTSFASAVAQEVVKDNTRNFLAEQYVNMLRAKGFKKLRKPDNLVHADYGLYTFLDKKQKYGIDSVYINGWDVGTPVTYRKNAYICPHAVVFLDEPSRYFDNRNSAGFPEFVQQIFQLHRHFKLTFVLIYQDIDDIDLKIRKKFHRVIKMQNMIVKKCRNGTTKKVIWEYYEYRRFAGKNAYTWASDVNVIPLTTAQKKRLYNESHPLRRYFPFSLFASAELKRYINDCEMQLYNSQCAEACKYKFKGDLSKIYDTDFFEPTMYNDPSCKSEEEYVQFAKNMEFVNEKSFRKPKNLKEYYTFNKNVVIERPEDYVRSKTGQKDFKAKE